MIALLVIALVYIVIGMLVGSIMFGISCLGGAPAKGFHLVWEWIRYAGYAQLWGPYLVWLISGTILGD